MKNMVCFFYVLLFSFSTNYMSAQNGLKGEYYDGRNFERKAATRIDNNIDFYWNDRPPVRGIDPHVCSIRWTGKLMSPETGVYTFSARVDDGIRVWVGGKRIINNWQLNDVGVSEGKIRMEAGKYYDLKVEYFNALIEGEITLLWQLPEKEEERSWFDRWWNGDNFEVVPAEYLFQPEQQMAVRISSPVVEEEKEEFVFPIKKDEPAERPKFPAPPTAKPKPAPAVVEKTLTLDTLQKYIPKNIQFERAKTEILPASFPELDNLADFLNRNKHHTIKIEGHTDNVGDAYKNIVLSQKRANAVAAYLVKKGVHYERLEAEGFGGSKPLVKNDGRKYHPENRRVEFVVE